MTDDGRSSDREAAPGNGPGDGTVKPSSGAGSPAPNADADPRVRLEGLRREMSDLTERLIRLVGERLDLAIEIGSAKRSLGLPVLDPAREARVVRDAAARARELGVDPEVVRDIVWRIIAAAREAQGGPSQGWPDPGSDAADDAGG